MSQTKKVPAPIISLTVRAVMSHKVATVTGATPLIQVAQILARRHISCVVVVKDKIPMGIASERDLVKGLARAAPAKKAAAAKAGKGGRESGNGLTKFLAETPVSAVMSSPVEVLPVCTPLDKAVTLMQEK